MTTETKQRRVRIVQDFDPQSPREWDNFGRMVCWHCCYTLGDEQPKESSDEWLASLASEASPRLEELLGKWQNESWCWLSDLLDARSGKSPAFEEKLKIVAAHTDQLVAAVLKKHYVILPLYLYDHSGITMNTAGFSCPWDSGQVGWIYCSLDEARKNWLLSETADWDTPVEWKVPGREETISLREATEKNLRCEVETYDQYLTGDVYGFVVEEYDGCEACGRGDWEHVDSCWGFFSSNVEENGMFDHITDPELREMAKQAEIEYPRY